MTWVYQDIQLANFVMGQATLFRFVLPEGWRLKRGFSHPELHATHWRQDVCWVASAYIHYLLESDDGAHLLEMSIHVGPQPFKGNLGDQTVSVGGHPARLERRQVRRGPPWRRREANLWRLTWFCPATERHFQIEVVGRVPKAVLLSLVEAWRHLECHR